MRTPPTLSLLLAAVSGVFAAFDPGSKSNVAVYWGQNSVGTDKSQLPLGSYCDSKDVDIFILAFLVGWKNAHELPDLNFANQGTACNDPAINDAGCSKISDGIKTCQKNGKVVLLSIGGAQGTTFKDFESEAEASDSAQAVWDQFGPDTDTDKKNRPFGDAVVDGFDLDIEQSLPFMGNWTTKMRELINKNPDKQTKYLTAAPQCPNPENNDRKDIIDSAKLDMVFVQFYNNPPCNAAGTEFNFEAWDTWAKGKQNTTVYVGLPAQEKAGVGFVDATKLGPVIEKAKTKDTFGGVMLWDASQSWANNNYEGSIKKALTG